VDSGSVGTSATSLTTLRRGWSLGTACCATTSRSNYLRTQQRRRLAPTPRAYQHREATNLVDSVPREADRSAPGRVEAAAEWSAAVIAAARLVGPVPRYGGDEWRKLPTTDPRFAASVAMAADCWLDHCSPRRIGQQIADELIAERQLDNARRDDLFRAAAARVRHLSMVPTQEALRARRQAVAS
jgi:hypothetical protein